MARLAGVDLPVKKRAEIGLTYIYGIGRTRAKSLCHRAGINPDTKVADLTEDRVTRVARFWETGGGAEGALPKGLSRTTKPGKERAPYRGLRPRRGCPV